MSLGFQGFCISIVTLDNLIIAGEVGIQQPEEGFWGFRSREMPRSFQLLFLRMNGVGAPPGPGQEGWRVASNDAGTPFENNSPLSGIRFNMPSTSRKDAPPSSAERQQRGRVDRTVRFPIAPPLNDVPAGYSEWLGDLKSRIRTERLRVVLASNAAMVMCYWDLGQSIREKQDAAGWGARVIDRLAGDLREAFPDMKGFSPRNLKYMRAFATAWSDRAFVQEVLARLTWYHILALLEKLKTPEERLWYADQAWKHGWSRNILTVQIEAQAHLRHGKAQNNFPATLPPLDSDLAALVFKDPYLFDFLGTDAPRREAELQRGLMEHLQKFLLELGQGFAFVGQQVHLELGDQDYYLDLLFYHLKLRCYVAIELKARPFEPGDGAQLGIYMHAVDKLLTHPDDKPTVGLLLVRTKNRVLVEYALAGSRQPISVSQWETQLTHHLPENLRGSLPSIEEIEAEMAGVRDDHDTGVHEPD